MFLSFDHFNQTFVSGVFVVLRFFARKRCRVIGYVFALFCNFVL